MAKIKGAVVIDQERCKGCNLCVVACPTNSLSLSSEVNHRGYNYCVDSQPDTCVGCTSCALICPDACISVYKIKVDE